MNEVVATDPEAVAGKLAFESKCLACHSVGQGKKLGPDVAGVTKRRSDDWLARWLKSPEKMLETDAVAKAMLKEYNNIPMPNQSLSDEEIRQYMRYFHWIDAQPRLPRTLTGDPASVARGRTIFNDPKGAACATCHTGSNLTNNQTVDVGTGGKFQVPSLVGIGSREIHRERRTLADLADHPRAAATPRDDAMDRREAEPGTFADFLGGVEGLEQTSLNLG